MVDNVFTANPASNDTQWATDDLAGVHHLRVKVQYGGDGSATDVATGSPLPVDLRADNVGGAGLKVDLGADNDVTVTGTVTANAGTDLNTSALALEAGGNLAAIAASLAILDDWDEIDRAKVNPIAGQAGVQGGSGIVTALTQRVVLATDVALPAGTNAIGKLAANSGVDIGDVDVLTVPADPFGANADAASTTGSISAKLRQLATDLNAVVSGSELQVDVVTSALPTGAATSANQSTLVTQTQPAQSHYRNIDANAEDAIKASAGVLHWMHVINLTAAVAYLHLYDATTATVIPGTTTPTHTFAIPTQGDTNGAGFALPLGPNGQNFSTAITLVVTTTLDGSAGDPGTNGVIVNAGYT